MKFLFGNPREYNQYLTIEAKALDHAIKLFKVEELFPERCVAPEFVAKREYHGRTFPEYTYEWKGKPLIDIWVEQEVVEKEECRDGEVREFKRNDWVKTSTISLEECINVDYATLLPQNRQLLPAHEEAVPSDETEELLPVIGKASAITSLPKMALRALHNEIAEKKAKFELEAQRLNEALDVLRKEIEKKGKMLRLLITFMGINEEVVQIADGLPADESEPLAVYQQLLFCDEEMGVWKDGGLDIDTLEDFDKWVAANINTFLYRPRSVVAWQVRRHDKKYCDNKLENLWMNLGNNTTYLLIRNGQRLYRIWSDIAIPSRLFPTKAEYEKIMGDDFGNEEYRLEKLKKQHETYMFGLVALQGLIERTDVLGPGLRGQVNLIKNQLGGKVRADGAGLGLGPRLCQAGGQGMKNNPDRIQHEKDYIAFLEKRLASGNFHANVSKDEVESTKAKLKKARLVLRCLEAKK